MNQTIILTNITGTDVTLYDLGNTTISGTGSTDITDLYPIEIVGSSDDLSLNIKEDKILINNGTSLLSKPQSLSYLNSFIATTNPHDTSGKVRVHQTSRKLGLRICWTGEGDDSSNPVAVGGGQQISFTHKVGDTEPNSIYIDINCVENETWLHEGYVSWQGGQLDTVSLSMVPRLTSTAVSTNTNYNVYGGYLIIPAAGDGTIDITSDITTHSGGLVYLPDDDLGNPPTAFWNADWNTSTKVYENITAAPNGDGRYNMFSVEVILAKFVNKIPLLSSGFIALNSSDTDELGHGMRLKLTADTNTDTVADHDWSIACILCMHRKSST